MQWGTQYFQGCFPHDFRQGGMSMNGVGHLLEGGFGDALEVANDPAAGAKVMIEF